MKKKKNEAIELIDVAYKLLLGRSPESMDAIQSKVGLSIEELRQEFINSYEFKIIHRNEMTPKISSGTISTIDNEEANCYLREIIKQWTILGNNEPYWSVFSSDEFSGKLSGSKLLEFYLSGQDLIHRYLEILKTCGFEIKENDNVLELGCGVGRITKSIAENFSRVTAIDISPGNLLIAREALSQFNNVTFLLATEFSVFDSLDTNYNHFISMITLQHNPPEIQKLLLQKILSKLEKTNSFAFFQTVTSIESNMAVNMSGANRDAFNTYAFPMREILAVISDSGFHVIDLYRDDFQLDPEFHSYSFIIGRKI